MDPDGTNNPTVFRPVPVKLQASPDALSCSLGTCVAPQTDYHIWPTRMDWPICWLEGPNHPFGTLDQCTHPLGSGHERKTQTVTLFATGGNGHKYNPALYVEVNKPVHAVLQCQHCSEKQGRDVFKNRDTNAARNTRDLLVRQLRGETRPEAFRRGVELIDFLSRRLMP